MLCRVSRSAAGKSRKGVGVLEIDSVGSDENQEGRARRKSSWVSEKPVTNLG